MKKILSCILCLVMVLSLGTTAFASGISTDGGSQNVTITYGTSESFVVTIPAAVTIIEEVSDFRISASNVIIGANKELDVKISSNDYVDKWELIDVANPENRLEYVIEGPNGNVKNNDTVLSVLSGEAHDSTKTADFVFVRMDEATKSGTYTDTLTFNVEVIVSDIIESDVLIETDSPYLRPVFSKTENMVYVYLTNEGRELFNSIDWENHEGYTNFVSPDGQVGLTWVEDWSGLENRYIGTDDFLVKFSFWGAGNYSFYLSDFCQTTITITGNVENSKKTFTIIDGVYNLNYIVDDNMTWGDWIDSEYNTAGYFFTEEYGITNVHSIELSIQSVMDENGMVDINDVIENNGNYYLETYEDVPEGFVNEFELHGADYSYYYFVQDMTWGKFIKHDLSQGNFISDGEFILYHPFESSESCKIFDGLGYVKVNDVMSISKEYSLD